MEDLEAFMKEREKQIETMSDDGNNQIEGEVETRGHFKNQ